MQNAELDESQVGIKISRRSINSPWYADDTTLMAEIEEELKSLLIKVKEEGEKIGKGVCQGCILSPCLFNLYAEYIIRNAGLEEAQAGIKMLGEISITSDMQMTSPLW